ncbi:MAG: ABC transporter permease [Clostridia bacterium]|nr:ABC transporter permease [Clostridia bacterium]
MRSSRFKASVEKYAMPLALVAFILLLQIFIPNAGLLAWTNLKTILLQTSVLGFLSLGLSFVMISGNSDISFAGTLGMMGALFTMAVNTGMGYLTSLVLIICIGMAVSLVIGLLVTRFGISAFIVSIAFMFMGLGLERSFNEGITIWITNTRILDLGKTQWLSMYMFTWLLLTFFAIAFIVIRKTKLGFHLRIIGENINAGQEAGVRASRIKIIAFLIAGAMYAFAGSIEPIRMGGSIVGAGQSYMLPALAACYLGSTMFTPGRVNILGTLIGSVFMTIISNFMQLLSLPYYFSPLVQGLTLLLAVGISVFHGRGTIQQVKV